MISEINRNARVRRRNPSQTTGTNLCSETTTRMETIHAPHGSCASAQAEKGPCPYPVGYGNINETFEKMESVTKALQCKMQMASDNCTHVTDVLAEELHSMERAVDIVAAMHAGEECGS